MGRQARPVPAALGFRVKSGWATAVLIAGPVSSPSLLDRRVVLLSDPAVPESKQPYHAALDVPEKDGRKIVETLRRIVERAAKRAVTDLLKDSSGAGRAVRAAALVVGSQVDPATLHNEHIRAHALEGQLFRTVLEDALRSYGIPCSVLVEKTAYGTAAAELGHPESEAKRVVAALGDAHDGPWRAEEKLAAVAAWMMLAKRR